MSKNPSFNNVKRKADMETSDQRKQPFDETVKEMVNRFGRKSKYSKAKPAASAKKKRKKK